MKLISVLAVICLLGLCSAGPCSRGARSANTLVVRDPGECEPCRALVESVESYLVNVDTQEVVTEFINAAVCKTLPEALQESCEQEVSALYAQAVSMLTATLTPDAVCSAVGVCPSSSSMALFGSEGVPFGCPMCRLVVKALVERLQDPKTREQIHANLLTACGYLDVDAKAKCTEDVSMLFASLDALSKDLNPDKACEFAKFCKLTPPSLGAVTLPESVSSASTALATLFKGRNAVAESAEVDAEDNDAICDECKVIVTQAASVLADPKTQEELLDYAKQGCDLFPAFKDECISYVTLYGPLVLNLGLSYLQPDAICSSIGYCPPGPGGLAAITSGFETF